MEDDKIKDIFQGFKPEVPSDRLFMARLQRRIDAVEFVKQHNAQVRHRCRIAVVVAALSGFISGVILTLLFPVISRWLSSITISLPSIGIRSANFDGQILSWILIAATCVTIAINTYDLTLSRLSLNSASNKSNATAPQTSL